MSDHWKENLPDFQKRYLKSDFEHYKEKYKEVFQMKREDGILELRMHTNGGPMVHSWVTHEVWPAAWAEIGNDPYNEVIIITGTGDLWVKTETSVWDLPFREWPPDAVQKAKRETHNIMEKFVFGIDVPVITCINGPGPHTEFAVASDITLCTEDAQFWDPHFLGGSSPGDGMGLVLQQVLGVKRAAYYCYTGKPIDGKMAVEFGLANECLPREQLLPRAWELARFMMDSSTRALRYATHSQLMRPWKKALVEDLAMHGFSMSYAFLLNEKGVKDFLDEQQAKGMLK